MSPDALRGMARRLLRGTNRLIRALREDDISLLAAAIAFYGILSISPILVFAVAIAGFVMSEKAVLDEAMDAVAANVGPDAAETLSHSVSQWRDFGQTPWTMITAVLVTLYASTRLFAQMQTALNTIWHADGEGPAGWWLELRGRLLTLRYLRWLLLHLRCPSYLLLLFWRLRWFSFFFFVFHRSRCWPITCLQ